MVSPRPQPRLSLWSLISKAFVDIVRSVPIGRIFRVQNALHLLEMRDREIRDLFPVLRGPLGDVVGQHIEGLAGRISLHQYLAGALDGVHVVESLADRVRGDENAV